MHELSICTNIINIIKTKANGKRIKKIWLRIGELAGVDNDIIYYTFPIAARDTIAANAILELITVQPKAKCNYCHKEINILTLFDACQYCNSYDYEIIQGHELQIVKMEIE
ncbi:MAG: hydrogenase maturation nickel metallochaperone HypA [Gammaproteobacteria bacterium]